ncbi:MAG: hypothetical protein JJU34_09965 [Lunatimonas sp.]|uniref:hypothetical protein n=1 Tax=Lunatimonas sp. TaxID=2060141 RepID=UPI00263B7E0E|nr:hypothetical protein [Lunatimonas sp.]MCC5937598.1 hypothetical protein [Lunatimonas sp.]
MKDLSSARKSLLLFILLLVLAGWVGYLYGWASLTVVVLLTAAMLFTAISLLKDLRAKQE